MRKLASIELSDLPVRAGILEDLGLIRLPTWDELYEEICNLVRRPMVPGSVIQMGGQGRCLLYAGILEGCLKTLLSCHTDIHAGGIGILFENDRTKGLSLPDDVSKIDISSESYHVVCVFLANKITYLADFSYHQFHEIGRGLCGPEQFFVANQEELGKEGVFFHDNEEVGNHVRQLVAGGAFLESAALVLASLRDRIANENVRQHKVTTNDTLSFWRKVIDFLSAFRAKR